MTNHPTVEASPRYLDAQASLEERVDDLLARMTTDEKIAQLRAIILRGSAMTQEGVREVPGTFQEQMQHGIGQVENTFDPDAPASSVEKVNTVQRFLREQTRLGIPAIIGSECLHGHAGAQSTVLPTPLAMASSWNPGLVHEGFDMVAREARARGAQEAHTPVIDLGRDPRWGRIEETYGEDTHLVTRFAHAVVTGLQGGDAGDPGTTHLVSAPKHFAGYGQVAGGRNFAATPIDDLTLFDDVLPPFETVVREARAQGMMASHCDVRGVPAHGNRWLLTELLREQWGFPGYVVSDYNDVSRLEEFMHVAESPAAAAAMALRAGLDMDLPAGAGYAHLGAALAADPSLESALDDAVRRVLRLKFRLGLFENPFADIATAERTVGHAEHRALAARLADESIVLLRNEGELLPLDPARLQQIAVIGPNADSREMGTYTMANRHATSILDGLRARLGDGVRIVHEPGCRLPEVRDTEGVTTMTEPTLAEELPTIERAVAAAAAAEVVVLCLGGNLETAREAYYVPGIKGDRSTLHPLGQQLELARRVLATGRPVVLVLMGGRPLAIPELAAAVPAILNTFYLGQSHGHAIARVLCGDVNPSGKLPVSMPRSVGQLPVYYSQKAISFYKDYLEESACPLYAFGHGLSYTSFHYETLEAHAPTVGAGEAIELTVTVRNTGQRAGAEVVQLYFRDLVASVTRPERKLVRFAKVMLEPGEVRRVIFTVDPAKDLSFTTPDGRRVTEPGAFAFMAGGASDATPLRTVVTLR